MGKAFQVIQGGATVVKKPDWKMLLEEGRKALAKAIEIRVHPSKIHPMPGQPRVYFSEDAILRLADSIRSVGQVYPGIVRKVGDDSYELIDGERRWRAVTLVGIEYRALRVEISNDAVPFLIAAIANFNREAHTPLEIADAIERMYDEMGMPIEEIAKVMGFKVPWAYAMLSLRFLHEEVREMLDLTRPKEQRIPLTAAIQISKMKAELQARLARRVLAKEVSLTRLRKEVVRVSDKAGAPVRTVEFKPSKRWKSIGLRVSQLRRMTHDLQQEFGQKDFPMLLKAGTSGFTSSDVMTAIQDTRRYLDGCENLLLKARRNL